MTASPPAMIPALENVVKRFGDKTVLDGISLSVTEGAITCLLGPSGCGKSTLLRVAASLLPVDAGRALLDPRDCAVVFQDPRLLPWLTVAENLGLAIKGGARRANTERIAGALAQVELDGVSGLLPRELSGGMAQRVGIARALLRNPRILLMDEPFAALDAITRSVLQKMLVNLIAERKITCLFVTHDINEALLIADRLRTMQNGRLVHDIPPREGRAQESIRRMILASLQGTANDSKPEIPS